MKKFAFLKIFNSHNKHFFNSIYYAFICFFLFAPSSSVVATEKLNIHWTGLEDKLNIELLTNVKQYVALAQEPTDKLSSKRIDYLFKQAKQQISNALKPFGYYHVQVKSQLIPPDINSDSWEVHFDIQLNQPIRIHQLNIHISGDARQDKRFNQFLENIPLKVGAALNHPAYEKAKQGLLELAHQRGYSDAKINKHEIRIHKKKQQATINIIFDSGVRYHICTLDFDQNYFNPQIIQRLIPFQLNSPYERSKILDLRHALMDSQYFDDISIQEETLGNSPTHCIALKIKGKLKGKDQYRGRIGFGTDTGVRLGLDTRFNYLNRFGHSFQGNVGYTVKRKRHLLKGQYLLPMGNDVDRYLKLSMGYKAEDFSSQDVDISDINGLTRVKDISLAASWHQSRTLFQQFKLHEVLSLEYLSESYNLIPLLFSPEDQPVLDIIASDPELAGEFFPVEGIKVLTPQLKVFSLGLNWSYENADEQLFTNQGYRLDGTFKTAAKSLGSDVSYWQAHIKSKYIQRLNRKSRLLLRGEVAYTHAKEVLFFGTPIIQLPRDLLFATGGSSSIRGYSFEELNDKDTLPRARHLLVASLEYEYEILPQWSLAAFCDVGNAFNNFSSFVPKTGLGLGLRWHSPVGMIRLDVAYAKDRRGSPIRLHFTIGPDF